MRRWFGWRLWTILVLAFVLIGQFSGSASAVSAVAASSAPAATSIRSLTSTNPLADDPVPADFAAVMGYTPIQVADAEGTRRWVSPRGSCSAPTGSTKYDFWAPCAAHDLGYDLLRYAAATGHPLGPWARQAVDAAFGQALARRCAEVRQVGCSAAAAVYHDAVVFNSWRQNWRAPSPEPALPWILLATGLTLAPVLVNGIVAGLARRAERRNTRVSDGVAETTL